jgi:polyribonucleotide nucleotidyltransferase
MRLVLIALLTVTCFAEDAHEHGKVNLDIAFEGKTGIIMLHGSAEAFLGFEHEAKSKAEKKVLKTLKDSSSKLESLIGFDKSLNCKSTRTSFGFNKIEEHDDHDHKDEKEHKGHQNFKISYKVECSKAVEKTKISFDFSKALKNIHEVELQFINNTYQTGKEIESSKGSFDVK